MPAISVRLEYKAIKEQILDVDNLLVGAGFENLVKKANTLYERATTMRGRMEDIECIRDMVYQLNTQVKNLCKKTGTTTGDFMKSLQSQFVSDVGEGQVDAASVDWEAIGSLAAGNFCSISGLQTMLGPMDAEPRQRKVGIRAKRGRTGEATVVKEISTGNEDSAKKETEANMELMFSILRKRKHVPFVNLVLNRSSFSQTIENIFAFSFLVKDGRVKLTKDENMRVVAVPMNAPSDEDRSSGKAKNVQFVNRVDFKDWEAMKEMIPAGSEIMPNRSSRQEATLNPQNENSNTNHPLNHNDTPAGSQTSNGASEGEENARPKRSKAGRSKNQKRTVT